MLGLGPGLFYNSPMEACVVICRTEKPTERKGKVLFIDAVNEVARERAQSFLRESHIEKILDAYRVTPATFPGLLHVATLDEIAGQSMRASASRSTSRRTARHRRATCDDRSPSKTAIAQWRSRQQRDAGCSAAASSLISRGGCAHELGADGWQQSSLGDVVQQVTETAAGSVWRSSDTSGREHWSTSMSGELTRWRTIGDG